jgi:hypothetical protein
MKPSPFAMEPEHSCASAVQRGSQPLSFEHGDCCRSARTSSEVSTRLRKNARMATRNAVIKASTNPLL